MQEARQRATQRPSAHTLFVDSQYEVEARFLREENLRHQDISLTGIVHLSKENNLVKYETWLCRLLDKPAPPKEE
jgi:DNA-dependent RNA polymerase auxiliary subunit epsilon